MTKQQADDFARVLLALRHMVNRHMLDPLVVTQEGHDAQDALERAIGKKEFEKVYKSKVWIKG